MKFPLTQPKYVLQDSIADAYTEKNVFAGQGKLQIVINKLKHKKEQYFN